MEDHMTLLDKRSTGRSSVTTATDSMESDPNLCDRVKILEQKAGSAVQPESYLRNRIRLLERSERSLLLQLCQLASASHLPSMQHTQRLDQRLHMLREEVRTMTREKEQVDQVWRERLQRCQRQLKTKEEEMSRQSQYFENFKAQLQHKLSLAHNREQGLQSRISTLEKQLLDLTVSAATGTAAISAVRITAGTSTHWEEKERLTFMRGQGEGEEEKKEEIKKQWWPSVRIEREGGRAGDKGKTEKETEGGRNKDTRQNSNEARLQGFILSLQEDLRVLLEREEDGMTERRQLTEQLQEAQENSHFLSCKVEDMKAEVHQLKLSEHSLMEEVEQLRQKNHRLQQILREAANQTTSQSSAIPESTCLSPGPSSPSCSISKKVQPKSDDEIDQSHSPAVPPGHHQATAEATQNNTENHSSSAKSDPLKLSVNQGSKPNPSFQSLTLTTETTDELTLGTWFSRGFINLQNSPSEESDALREAYRSLGLQEDLEALHEQGEAAMQHIQEQLQMMAQENSQLKLQLRKQAEEEEAEAQQGLSREKINSSSTCDGADHLQSSSIQDETILALAQNDLVQALNQENRALADRIQELLAHIELREEEMKTEESELKNHVSRLEEDRARLEQENQEQGCLITELTRKTEDDLNTIMELQQQLEKSGEQCNLEECIDSLVENVLKGAEPQLISSQQTDDLTTGSAPGFQHKNHYDPLQNSPQNTLHVSSSADQVDQLTKSIQTLKREQEELSGCINDLREQQREVALSVQTQTEEKQQLTRTVWGLKEEKDSISQSLAGLKQEREELNRIVCVLKDERDHFIRSMSGLKEEKEQLTKALSGLQREKEAMIESLSSGKEERDQIMQSVQGLQTENDQLKQAVLNLKQERDHLTDSLKCLKDQRDQEHSCYTLQEQCDKLMKSVSSLGEEKESIEYSVHCLRQEEKQMMLIIQGLREERNSLQTATGTGEYGNSLQEQRDLVREIEEELEKSQVEVKKMDNELCQSEVRRVEAERKATQAAEKVMRLTDVANQMEETRKENERLKSQVKELQSKLIGLTREMSDALSLKIHIEEQYSVLTAQLKAKTVALEELNSEYIALKQGQGSKDDLSTALTSLRTHYNDIRAKYDALLKRKSQTDVDIAPLKAKLSCLVVKCQERNSLLLQLMKAMHRQGCVDSVLTQQVEQLLRDAALQDYSAAFTPGSNVNTQDCSTGFIPGFVSKFQDFTSGFTPDQTCSAVLPSVNKHHQTGFNSESDIKYRESGKHTSIVTSESTTNFQVCSHEITPTPIRAPKKNANSSVPNSPVKEQPSVQVSPSPVIPLKEGLSRNTTQQLSPSASGPVQATSGQKTFGFHDPNMKEKSSPDLTGLTESSLTSSPPPSSTHISPSRRLSSPEKIINLHEQLQKTLMSSYQ
nr:trichohyalin-like isoform X2 [Monopterus albus]